MLNIKQYIIDKSKELGFDLCRFAKAEALETEFEHYQKWLSLGYAANMQYLHKNSHKRKDPREILPSAKTVVVLGHNYKTPFDYSNCTNRSGFISRYAWGDDYHEVLNAKAHRLIDLLQQKAEFDYKIYVDTGSILERAWAVRSGIGWQGKNGNVINFEIGSFIFLCTILISLEIEPDDPVRDYCGTCQRCIIACPTGAIVQPKVVDARLCLSYWNIEAKPSEEIPENIKQNIVSRLFGCDICQEVCPYNKKELFTEEKSFYPRAGETCLDIDYIINMSQNDFSLRFKHSPIKRKKFEGLKQIAAIISENIK